MGIRKLIEKRFNIVTEHGEEEVVVRCPFKECDDNSGHLWINTSKGVYHCWICGAKGTVRKLFKILNFNDVIRVEEETPKKRKPPQKPKPTNRCARSAARPIYTPSASRLTPQCRGGSITRSRASSFLHWGFWPRWWWPACLCPGPKFTSPPPRVASR